MLEIFCGTAGVTASFKRIGFQNAVAVDKFRPQKPLASVLVLDLTNSEQQDIVLSWIRNPATQAVFLAPPCGTASAARNIILNDEPGLPQPLRSDTAPDGLPDLSGTDFERVGAANILYQFVCDVFRECQIYNVACAVENPLNSLFWSTTPWCDLHSSTTVFYQTHQACMYGSKRPKWTMLAANFKQIESVNKTCDQSHTHERWGVQRLGNKRIFATSLEVHYPKALCDAISNAFMLRFAELGLDVDNLPKLQQTAQASTFKQTAKSANLVPAYKTRLVALRQGTTFVWPAGFQMFPAYKTLLTADLGDVGLKSFDNNLCKKLQQQLIACGMDACLVENVPEGLQFNDALLLGVQWDPNEFIEQVLKAKHPCELGNSLPGVVCCKAVEDACTMDDVAITKKRLMYLKRWRQRAKELQDSESALKNSMDSLMSKAVASKRILLFEEMLRDVGYPDMGVVDELKLGAQLVGKVPMTNMLPQRFAPSMLTEKMLLDHSALVRGKFLMPSKSSNDAEIDNSVWEQTLQEVADGWLQGPLELGDVPENAPISRRFGIRQGAKIRCVDDFSASCVNDSVTVGESPLLRTVDACGALMLQLMMRMYDCNRSSKLVARTFDLTSAYRQVPLRPESRKFSYIAVHEPCTGRWKFFVGCVLPFGAVRSVHSFLRLSRAIWHLGCVGLSLSWTSFYDDFVVFSPPSLSRSAELAVISLFKILGWAFAESGKKCVPFGDECSALGVQFNMAKSEQGLCEISNTDKRISELVSDTMALISKGSIGRAEAQKLRGRMQFAEG